LAAAQPIPDDGRWLRVCLFTPPVPEGAIVARVHVKYSIDHPDPDSLEIFLSRDPEGLRQPLWEHGRSPQGATFGRAPGLTAFAGTPASEIWYLWIRDTVPGGSGWLRSAGVVVDYAPIPVPDSYRGPPPVPAFRLPEGIPPSSPTLDRDPPKSEGGTFHPASSGGWQEIKSETFEGVFPNAGWNVWDGNPSDGLEYFWDDDDCRPHGGSWAAWPANGGIHGYDPCVTPFYRPHMRSWMVYGPFDARDARAVEVRFWLWRQIEPTYDKVWFAFSNDGGTFYGWWWDGTAGWEEKRFDLTSYLAGDASVWVGWMFESDGSVQYEGPWVDDILIRKYVPGTVTVRGSFFYADRSNNPAPASFTKVYLYDQDPGGSDDLLDTTVTDANGFFQFSARANWDEDDPDPNPENRRLDLYVVWETDVNDSASARRRVTNLGGWAYRWWSGVQTNAQDGTVDFNYWIPPGDAQLPAMWIFQDLRRAWEYIRNSTGLDPGSVTAKWQSGSDCYPSWPFCSSFFYAGAGGPFIFIADSSRLSGDTVVHEAGHHYMWNKTGWWLWWDIGCYDHHLFSQEDVNCAWSEGWADFLPLVVNGDECYDFGRGPCSGIPDRDHYDLEAHSRSDDPQLFPWGDAVEGRVAGALYDLFDGTNEGFDSATFGFAPIANIVFQAPHEDSFSAFWDSWKGSGQNKHHAIRAIYQNTIDYDTPPRFEPPLPDRTVLQGFSWPHAIDLWAYAVDEESADREMGYQIVNVTDWRCGASLEGNRWVNLTPITGWLGSCDVTIRVSDSLKTTDDTFRVNIVPVRARVFLPLVLRNSP